jgi:hypothetical protein
MLVVNSPLPAKVSYLWVPGTQTWNNQLLSTTFSTHTVHAIETTLVVNSNCNDILMWARTKMESALLIYLLLSCSLVGISPP